MARHQQFYNNPVGAEKTNIPCTEIADTLTSVDLITNSDFDYGYFRSLESQGIKLNKNQIAAVRHVNGPMLTLAGAGSGKTSVLVSRAGYLIKVAKVDPASLLIVTFSRKAAEEMIARIAKLPGLSQVQSKKITAGTFHSFFLALIRRVGINNKILSEEKYKQTIVKILLKKDNLEDAYQAEALLSLLSSSKTQMIDLHNLPEKTDTDKQVKSILLRYEQWKSDNHFMDFDDILVKAHDILRRAPGYLEHLQQKYRHCLIDEFQDTNKLQYTLLRMLAEPQNNLFIVGDDDQTIYSFNGSTNTYILNFEKDFPGAKVVTLDVNYRSHSKIVGLGNEVIKQNKKRRNKTLKATRDGGIEPKYLRPATTDDEAAIIIQSIKEKVRSGSRCFKDIAILHRTANSARSIIEQLALHDIPFVSYNEGLSFYEQSTVRPIIDHLRLAIAPTNMEALEGILPTLYVSRERAMAYVKERELEAPRNPIMLHLLTFPDIKDFQKDKNMERMKSIKVMASMKPRQAIQEIRKHYEKYMETQRISLHKELIKEAIDEVEVSAARFETVTDFVQFVDTIIDKLRDMKESRTRARENEVAVMTIHRSKGLEFPVVYLIGCSETILPHSSALEADKMNDFISPASGREKVVEAIEEECRLAYVGITRAEEELYISSPSFYRGEKVEVSRFIANVFARTDRSATFKRNPNSISEEFLAWQCTKCSAWQRITSYEETQQETKECPLCKATMVKGSRTVG